MGRSGEGKSWWGGHERERGGGERERGGGEVMRGKEEMGRS